MKLNFQSIKYRKIKLKKQIKKKNTLTELIR